MPSRKHARLPTLRPRIATLDTRTVKLPAKAADPHYLSPEHRAWRQAVIARASGRCETPSCGRAEPRMFADHKVEIRDGGARFDLANGQCLCGSCHTAKTARRRAERIRA